MQVSDFDPVIFNSINTPPLFGLGRIEQISDFSIWDNGAKHTLQVLSHELEREFSRGKVGWVRVVSGGIGKFGWKGQFATVKDFAAAACAVELGLTNPVRYQSPILQLAVE